jgi:hypothetical protein
MSEEEMAFLYKAKIMVQESPALFGHLITACTQGIEDRVSVERERATDFETIAAAYMAIAGESRKTPTMTSWADGLIKAKMLKWEGKTCCDFSKEIEAIKGG